MPDLPLAGKTDRVRRRVSGARFRRFKLAAAGTYGKNDQGRQTRRRGCRAGGRGYFGGGA
jgi:hypothetical protein